MKQSISFLSFAFLMLVGLGACTTANDTTAPANLPLASDKPTFLFFYTDNWPPWARMQPIVNGFEQEYDTRVEFIAYNAQDGAEGEAFFRQLTLPGHPSFVIYAADGQQIYRGVGLVEESQLRQQIEVALADD